jgi:hypothetical protein
VVIDHAITVAAIPELVVHSQGQESVLANTRRWLWLRSEVTEQLSSIVYRAIAVAIKDKPGVAVLPILDASADPDAESLIDDLAESIVNSLSLLPELHVKACSTLVRYKRQEVDPQEAGRELGVEAVLISKFFSPIRT